MTIKTKIKSYFDTADYFKNIPFYIKPIEKPKIKRLKNIDLLFELPFYEKLSVTKTDKGYAMSYKVKIIKKKRSN